MSLRQFVPPPFKPPFSHTPGIQGWLVGSKLYAQFFPTAFFIYEACGTQKVRITFPMLGPVSDWTVFFDILRQKTLVQGVAKSGFFRFELVVEESEIFFKSLKSDLECEFHEKKYIFEKGKKYVLLEGAFSFSRFKGPELFLGKNKDLNVDRIMLHPDMLEILPLWYQMARLKVQSFLDSSSLLGSLFHAVEKKERLHVVEKFMQFFKTGIASFFVPKKEDTLFLGYPDPLLPPDLALEDVHEVCVALIRSLFLEEKENALFLLPCLPKECVCGHLLRERLLSGSEIGLEWRKGMIRRVLIHPVQDETIFLKLQHGIKSFCLTALGPHARKTTFQADSPLELRQGKRYLLDNFID